MASPKWMASPVLAAVVFLAGVASAQAQQSDAALGDRYASAGSFKAAGDAYLRAFNSTGDPSYLKKAGNEYLQLGSAGKNDAIKAFSGYVRGARTLDEATEGEKLLKQARALPNPGSVAAPTAAPAPAAAAPAAVAPAAPAPEAAPEPAAASTAPEAPAPASSAPTSAAVPAPAIVGRSGTLPASPSPAPLDQPYPYVVQTSEGPVTIDRTMPSEVGKWGWSWFGNHNFGPPGSSDSTFDLSLVGVRHWATPKWGWEGALGLVVSKPAGGTTITSFGAQGGLLYSLARYEYLNIFAAGHALFVPYGHPEKGVHVFQMALSGEVAAEFFLDGLQLFHSGPMLRTSHALSITFGLGLGFDYSNYSASGGGSESSAKLATGSASDVINGLTTGSLALTYYFGGDNL
jgi:hypothetical protein